MVENESWIHYGQLHKHYEKGGNLLSIKSFSGGHALYEMDHAAFLVDDDCYLVLNNDQEYALTIDSKTSVTFFCVFFEKSLAEEVYRSYSHKTEVLIDDPIGGNARTPEFYERTYAHDRLLSPALNSVRKAYPFREHEPGWLTEQYRFLLHRLLLVHHKAIQEVTDFPGLRPATRDELYRRLYLARDYIRAVYNRSVDLKEIAGIASLSPNHLLRTFKQAFGQTPHQFLIDERLRHAKRLLRSTSDSITDICLAVGFESLGSFSWLFRQRFGVSPTDYRKLR